MCLTIIYLSVAYILVVASTTDAVVAALVGYIGINWVKGWVEGLAPDLPELPDTGISGALKTAAGAVVGAPGPSPAQNTLDSLQSQLQAAKDALTSKVDVDITSEVQEAVGSALQAQSLKNATYWQEQFTAANPEVVDKRFTETEGAAFLSQIREQFKSGAPVDPVGILARQAQAQRENAARLDASIPSPSLSPSQHLLGGPTMSTRDDLMTGQSIWIPTPSPSPTAPTSTSTTTRRGTTSEWDAIVRGHAIS